MCMCRLNRPSEDDQRDKNRAAYPQPSTLVKLRANIVKPLLRHDPRRFLGRGVSPNLGGEDYSER